jgi:hypothetical protein
MKLSWGGVDRSGTDGPDEPVRNLILGTSLLLGFAAWATDSVGAAVFAAFCACVAVFDIEVRRKT